MKRKNCKHDRSHEKNGDYWKCQDCMADLTKEELEEILIKKRSGFEIPQKSDTIDKQAL